MAISNVQHSALDSRAGCSTVRIHYVNYELESR